MTREFGSFPIQNNHRQHDDIRVHQNQGAFWSTYDSGDRRYESRTPCNSPSEAYKIGQINALKAEAQQERNPVVLEEDGVVLYQNYASLERFQFSTGQRFQERGFVLRKTVNGVSYWVAV